MYIYIYIYIYICAGLTYLHIVKPHLFFVEGRGLKLTPNFEKGGRLTGFQFLEGVNWKEINKLKN